MSVSHEVFDSNYDYHYAAEQKRNPQKGLVQLMGERAIKWVKGLNAKRKAEKAERKYNGSLAEISPAIIPFEEAYTHVGGESAVPKPHKTPEPGVYRSMNAIHNPIDYQEEGRPNEGVNVLTDDMANLMQAAVRRARAKMADDAATKTTQMHVVRPQDETREIPIVSDDEHAGSGVK